MSRVTIQFWASGELLGGARTLFFEGHFPWCYYLLFNESVAVGIVVAGFCFVVAAVVDVVAVVVLVFAFVVVIVVVVEVFCCCNRMLFIHPLSFAGLLAHALLLVDSKVEAIMCLLYSSIQVLACKNKHSSG